MSTTNCIIHNPTKLIIKINGSPEIADYIKNDGIKKVLLMYG